MCPLPLHTCIIKDTTFIPIHFQLYIIHSFPICADTFRKAVNLLPRYSLGNQLVCPNLLEETQVISSPPWGHLNSKISYISKGKRSYSDSTGFNHYCWLSPDLQNPVLSPAKYDGCSLTPSVPGYQSLKSWTKVLTNRPCERINDLWFL